VGASRGVRSSSHHLRCRSPGCPPLAMTQCIPYATCYGKVVRSFLARSYELTASELGSTVPPCRHARLAAKGCKEAISPRLLVPRRHLPVRRFQGGIWVIVSHAPCVPCTVTLPLLLLLIHASGCHADSSGLCGARWWSLSLVMLDTASS
jgi:hypothetical protein